MGIKYRPFINWTLAIRKKQFTLFCFIRVRVRVRVRVRFKGLNRTRTRTRTRKFQTFSLSASIRSLRPPHQGYGHIYGYMFICGGYR
jgi:hypothetical protein